MATNNSSNRVNSTRKNGTQTSAFGVSKRENHDSSAFYARFPSLNLSDNETITSPPSEVVNRIFHGDSRNMQELPDNCVALVVTSPPYFSGKEYEADMSADGVPRSYSDYLEMLKAVFTECKRVMEPGGRIAVNVADLGRKPYRSLSSDVVHIFEEVGFLLRGEIIWIKADGASGNCAWGSYASASNPVLRDVTEKIIVASKGRFDRSIKRQKRSDAGLPYQNTISPEDFMAWTLDIWRFPPESAKRVNHPAPFPVELPRRLIELYTYKGDLVLDPFIGSGQTAIASKDAGRHYAGYDTVSGYVDVARRRVSDHDENFQAKSTKQALAFARECDKFLYTLGYTGNFKKRHKASIILEVTRKLDSPRNHKTVWFDYHGSFRGDRPGLMRTDTVKKAVANAAFVRMLPKEKQPDYYYILTSNLPKRGSAKEMIASAQKAGYIDGALSVYDEKTAEMLKDL